MLTAAVDGFGDVDDVVTQLLVERVETAVGVANGVVIDTKFQGVEVLRTEAVALGVDGMLGGIGGIEVHMVIVVQIAIHHVESFLYQRAHLLQIGVEAGIEVHSVFTLSLSRHGYLVDGVADGLEVINDAQHGADALGTVLRDVAGTHTGEELGDFHLHAVGDAFILGDALHEAIELFVALGGAEARQEGVHAEHALAELFDFALGALQVELGGGEQVGLEVGEAEFLFAILFLLGHHPGDYLLNLGNEEGQDDGGDDVEEGMEDCDGQRCCRNIGKQYV